MLFVYLIIGKQDALSLANLDLPTNIWIKCPKIIFCEVTSAVKCEQSVAN